MIRIQEILDKVAANNHDANLELIQKAYVFAATAHAGRRAFRASPICPIRWPWPIPGRHGL